MPTNHIVKSFDEDLKRLDNIIAEMGGMAEMLLANAMEALLKRDSEKANQVIANDKLLDALEAEVDELAVQMLALRQPMAEDLRVVITALRTASIIERIGDYAKNIAKRTVAISQAAPVGPTKTIGRMGKQVQSMIKNVLDAYITRDAVKAEDVRASDGEVDALHTSLFRELLTYMMEDPRNITACTHLLFVAKNIERMGDHATNIAENVHFLVNGNAPIEARTKEDDSSFVVVGSGHKTEGKDNS
ncbi:MAG: phosphate signaling complex protein PhoU [Rhodospirillales bacterium]|nr:phosphate signaling complex protein PhoU [Rhodospirillales bacterium]